MNVDMLFGDHSSTRDQVKFRGVPDLKEGVGTIVERVCDTFQSEHIPVERGASR